MQRNELYMDLQCGIAFTIDIANGLMIGTKPDGDGLSAYSVRTAHFIVTS